MKKLFFSAGALLIVSLLFAQENPPVETKSKKKDWSKVTIGNRANDHFMMQFGVTTWSGKPDSINTKGFSKSFNIYFLLDMPFKTDPRFSVALGPGFGTDHMFFNSTNVTIADQSKPLRFQNLKDTNHFNKYKLSTAYLELPVELRFTANPLNSDKSFKVAIGAKIGTLLSAYTKGKNWVDKDGNTVTGTSDKFIQKQKDKFYFNGNRLCGTLRVGYGNLSLYGSYQLGSVIKEGQGPQVKPYTIGITLSGL